MGTIFERIKKALFIFSAVAFAIAPSISFAAPKWKKIISNSSSGGLQGGFMEFNQDGTWTVPTGVTKIQVMVVGAGGGAGTFSSGSAGGGGGGSCVKSGATVLASADGGNGGDPGKSGLAGGKNQVTLTVTPGAVLNVYVGGGGGGAFYFIDGSYVSTYYSGAGGYGACGNGGNGGSVGAAAGGAGGLNKGGGSGAIPSKAGIASTSEIGAGLITASSTIASTGGTATSGGNSSSYGGGGGSGGIGGCFYAGNGGLATSSISCFNNNQIKKEPGEPGHTFYSVYSNGGYFGTGGGPGVVYIWW